MTFDALAAAMFLVVLGAWMYGFSRHADSMTERVVRAGEHAAWAALLGVMVLGLLSFHR